ncbi:MAG TPA: hypothetical protein VJY65_04420 [Chloroflexota bacterium]|nr:hypothetical protein [Chloroflexota bacterium]
MGVMGCSWRHAFRDVKEERDTYYTEIQADATRIAAEHGLEHDDGAQRDAPREL